jgi:GNAT superfamily N-acetyltransferase
MVPMNLEISTDPDWLDIDLIHHSLSESAYWAIGRPREVVQRSFDNSLCFGAYANGRMVGFARVVTDYATFAWLADVFVVEAYRGHGVGKALVQAVQDHPDLRAVRILLATRDAHGLYAQYGFEPVSPERYMQRPKLTD